MDAGDEGSLTVAGANQPATPKRKTRKTPKPLPAVTVDPAIVEQVIRWSIAGNRESNLRESIQTAWPDQDVDQALLAAWSELAAASKIPRETAIGWGFSATMEVYRRCMEVGDMALALRASRQIIELADRYGIDPDSPEEPANE